LIATAENFARITTRCRRWFAAAERDPRLVWFGTEPKLDPLRGDPRFKKIFRTTNNPPAFQ
jgi:hypothetical protein